MRSARSRTLASVTLTVLAGGAMVAVLASRGTGHGPDRPGYAASVPQAESRGRGLPRTATTAPHVSTAGAASPTVEGKPASPGAAPVPPLPAGLPADDAEAARTLLTRQLGVRDSAGEPSVRGATCAAGACVVSYRVDAHGAGVVFADQALIWKRLFADPHVLQVTLLVYHANVGERGSNRLPLYEETCKRAAVAALAAAGWDASAVGRRCRIVTRTPPDAAGA